MIIMTLSNKTNDVDTALYELVRHRLPFIKRIWKFKINWISYLLVQFVECICYVTVFILLLRRWQGFLQHSGCSRN
uniref:Uncharacterized protein n=1 Tax=Rhizophora mucronata TaxID=61149 RepID=A0A2P2LLC9_RHIMU